MRKSFLIVLIIFGLFSPIFFSCSDNSSPVSTTNDVTIQISDANIINAYITDFFPNNNFYKDDDFAAVAWISSTTPYIGRTLFKFNLSAIPQNATVTNAQFLLNYNQAPIHYTGAGHHQDSGSNASYLLRISQNWIDTSVNWINQPAVTQTGLISIDSSVSQFQNYSINMTAAINDMVKNPSTNYGFLFRLKNESPLRVLGFSSGYQNPNLKPVLQVTYQLIQ